MLRGRKVGTVHLDPTRRGTFRARLAPLPAFRSLAKHRRRVANVHEWELTERRSRLRASSYFAATRPISGSVGEGLVGCGGSAGHAQAGNCCVCPPGR